MPLPLLGLYAICDLAPDETDRALPLGGALLEGGACALQLRMKSASGQALFTAASRLASLCRARGIPLIVNDRLDVALAVGADGVHLGQEDLPFAEARRLAPRLAIGVSTHSLAQVDAALAQGADYLGFGPCFATRTKQNPDPVVGLELLAEAQLRARLAGVSLVAIGGIGLDELPLVVATGAPAAALISAVNGAPDVTAAARQAARCFTQR